MKRLLFVFLVVLVAGCSSLPGSPATGTEEAATDGEPTKPPDTGASQTTARNGTQPTTPTGASRTVETTGVPDATPTATPAPDTPTPTIDADPADNPWGKDTVTVALVAGANNETDYEAALAEAVEYWNTNSQYGEYAVEFVRVGDVDRADIQVEIRESVESCGIEHEDRVLGCAPLLEENTRADPPVTVTIEAGYNQQSTTGIMIHEFGHVLGIRHGEDPQEYMESRETVYLVAQPNATERAYPWNTTAFRFFADTDSLPQSERDEARDQIGHVIDYYERIKDNDSAVPDNITVAWTDNRSEANVLVEFPEQLPDGIDQGSSLSQIGFDPDGDGAIEYYRNVTIPLADIDTAAVGWHTGYWYGLALGLNESALPAPFQNAGYDERRSDWWTDAP